MGRYAATIGIPVLATEAQKVTYTAVPNTPTAPPERPTGPKVIINLIPAAAPAPASKRGKGRPAFSTQEKADTVRLTAGGLSKEEASITLRGIKILKAGDLT